ncbi:MAG: hypothetical protein LBQ33_07035 [Oscillospiraceae bacterium]|jgi:alpha-mannosidase|nr:hypothetical protein [Oscillospiraceae bacterium]
MRKPQIFTVATAHLDTSWRWTLEKTIADYLPKTLEENFALFEKYPGYVFSFEGAYRYELMEEYYPALFARLKTYAAQGRWRVAGAAYENGDVNIPSPEALLRNLLLGNRYFAETFGKRSRDLFLPDCFGFGYALPSVAAHANLLGFTTQKLLWGSTARVPFALGRWVGPDGKGIFACPDGRDYSKSLKKVRDHPLLCADLAFQRRHRLFPAAFTLHGVGDQGGAPKESSVALVCAAQAENQSEPVQVHSAGSDDIFRALARLPLAEQLALPQYRGEWLLSDHGTGGYTARTLSKRWNRQAEQLADAAERTSCFAGLLRRAPYPRAQLNAAWKRVLAHQFHDDITGVSNEESYRRNWNDLMLSQQQFAEITRSAVSSVCGAMDAGFAVGRCVAVVNPTQWPRREAVRLRLPQRLNGSTVRAFDGEGREVPCQLLPGGGEAVLLATVAPLGLRLFDLQVGALPCTLETGLHAEERLLENSNLRVEINADGDISSLYDKRLGRELLRAPVRLALFDFDGSPPWPAWELYYPELCNAPAQSLRDPQFRLLERGCARAALEITRRARGSVFRQVLSLDAASEWLRVENEIDWQSPRSLCKVEFCVRARCREAVYDLGCGVIRRGKNTVRRYEVPAQQWADLSGGEGDFGLSILSDSRTGWDMPNSHSLRLTAVYSPRSGSRGNAHLLDFGRNRFAFGLFPHGGDWTNGAVRAGSCFGQPLTAFLLPENRRAAPGARGLTELSFGRIDPALALRCFKLAEDAPPDAPDPEYILRVQETRGRPLPEAALRLGGGILSCREVYASEEPVQTPGRAVLEGGVLRLSMEPFGLRSFALRIKPPPAATPAAEQVKLPLPLDCSLTAFHHSPPDGRGWEGCSPPRLALPGERFPAALQSGMLRFQLGGAAQANALRCRGQALWLPAGREAHLLLLNFGGDRTAGFLLGETALARFVPASLAAIAGGDLFSFMESGFVKHCAPAWVCTHLHQQTETGWEDKIAAQCAVFHVRLPLRGAPATLVLPEDGALFLLAVTVSGETSAEPAAALVDAMERRTLRFAWGEAQEKQRKAKMRLRSLRCKLRFVFRYARQRAGLLLRLCALS